MLEWVKVKDRAAAQIPDFTNAFHLLRGFGLGAENSV
jgi:hypothetical protein